MTSVPAFGPVSAGPPPQSLQQPPALARCHVASDRLPLRIWLVAPDGAHRRKARAHTFINMAVVHVVPQHGYLRTK